MTSTRVPVATLWVCVDCLFAREGEPPESPDREPWGLLPDDDVTIGLMLGQHGCECREATDETHAEECERESFSWRPCDACGSHLGGERQAYTLWGPEPT